MDALFTEVCEILSAEAQTPLSVTEQSRWGGIFAAIRPVGVDDYPLFSIVLVPSRLRAEAHFVPDTFAGLLVRRMSDNLITDPTRWSTYIDQRADRVGITIRVDDQVIEPADAPETQWRSIEIECVTHFERRDLSDSRRSAFVEVAGTCLALVLLALENTPVPSADVGETELEGASVHSRTTRYERSPANRLRCLQYWGRTCWVCDFDFSSVYGNLGAGFIEVHHLTPLATAEGPVEIDPTRDLVPLCSNCHSMVHRHSVLHPLPPDQLRAAMGLPLKTWPATRRV